MYWRDASESGKKSPTRQQHIEHGMITQQNRGQDENTTNKYRANRMYEELKSEMCKSDRQLMIMRTLPCT
jgi:hypothetical protein